MLRASIILLLWIPLLASAAGPTKPVDLTMSWVLTLDKSGAIKSMQPTETKNAGLYQRLESGIRKWWKFAPGKVKGKADETVTTLTVHSTLTPVDGFYSVRVRDASTGPRYATATPPAANTASGPAGVLLEVRYDAEGRVTAAKVVPGGEPKAGKDAEQSAIAAVKQWTFKPELVGKQGIAGKARVPVCLAPAPGACRFTAPDTKKTLDADRPHAIGSVVRIETDVTAKEL
jgi:TonB family protein